MMNIEFPWKDLSKKEMIHLCICGRGLQCYSLSYGHYICSNAKDARASYTTIVSTTPSSAGNNDNERIKLFLKHIYKCVKEDENEEDDDDDVNEFAEKHMASLKKEKKKKLWIANHHFHPNFIFTGGIKKKGVYIPKYITEDEMNECNLSLGLEEQLVNTTMMNAGYYHLVPNYSFSKAKDDLDLALKKAKEKRNRKNKKHLDFTLLLDSSTTNNYDTDGDFEEDYLFEKNGFSNSVTRNKNNNNEQCNDNDSTRMNEKRSNGGSTVAMISLPSPSSSFENTPTNCKTIMALAKTDAVVTNLQKSIEMKSLPTDVTTMVAPVFEKIFNSSSSVSTSTTPITDEEEDDDSISNDVETSSTIGINVDDDEEEDILDILMMFEC